MTPGELVRRLYEAYDERAWEAAAAVLHADAVVDMPATRERLVGRDAIVSFQRAYPEPWGRLSVLRVVAAGAEAAAELAIVAPAATFRMAGFWRCADGLLRDGVEYWLTVGGDEVPPTRQPAHADAPE